MIKLGLVIFGISIIMVGISPVGWLTLIAGPLNAVGFSLLNVNIQSLISLESKADEQGIVMGVAQSFGALARVFGPLTGGTVATLNIALPYITSGIFAIVIFIFGKKSLKLFKSARRSSG
jgi:hypothetical protein